MARRPGAAAGRALDEHTRDPIAPAAGGHVSTAELLVAQGAADVRERANGFSLLHLAAGMGQLAAVRWLINPAQGGGGAGACPTAEGSSAAVLLVAARIAVCHAGFGSSNTGCAGAVGAVVCESVHPCALRPQA
jgi:hypothetical protein